MPTFVDVAYTRRHLAQGDPIVNVLSADQYRQQHIPGSLSVPLEEPGFERRIQQAVPDKARTVIVHCSSMACQASTKAARKLETLGYEKVHDFKAGIEGWIEAGNPTESGSAPARGPRAGPPAPGGGKASRREERRGQELPRT